MSSWWDSVWAAMFPDRGGETYIQRQARLASQTSGIDLSPLRGALVSVPVAGAYLGSSVAMTSLRQGRVRRSR
jgi:hypothetical protein